jgi:hypothetical protein
MMRKIVRVHFPDIDTALLEHAVDTFYRMRELDAVEKKPATRELLNWVRALKMDPDFKPKILAKGEVPYMGVLFKKSGDYERAAGTLQRRRMF